MQDTHHRDNLIVALLSPNDRRAAWPISAVLPLLRKLDMTISYAEFVALLARNAGYIAPHVLEDAKTLKKQMFERFDNVATRTRWDHYIGLRQ